MARRRKRSHTIELEYDPAAGAYKLLGAQRVPSAAEEATYIQQYGTPEPPGVEVRPTIANRLRQEFHVLPPVPGSIGHWTGKGTARDPKRWRGLDAKLVAEIGAAAVIVWGLGTAVIDVSNWYTSSSFAQLITGGQAKPRPVPTFWTWFFNTLAVQGTDLTAAVATIDSLSTGFSPNPPGVTGPPPNPGIGGNLGSTGGVGGTAGIASYNASRYGNRCLSGYTLMTAGTGGSLVYLCVQNQYVAQFQAAGYAVVSPQPPNTTQGG